VINTRTKLTPPRGKGENTMFTISYVVALQGKVKQIVTDNPHIVLPAYVKVIAVTMNEGV